MKARINWYGREVERIVHTEAAKKMHKIGMIVAADAKRFIVEMKAVDTGRLLSSIEEETDEAKLITRVGAYSHAGAEVDYAPYVFLGTHKMAARPALRMSVEKNKGTIERLLA